MAATLIHIGKKIAHGSWQLLFLRQLPEGGFRWFSIEEEWREVETDVAALGIEEALRLAHRTWKLFSFKTLMCGFRYTLPERDEHGMNALFCQMAASLASSNGIYLDPFVGHTCFVQNASLEAQEVWRKLCRSKVPL